MKLFGSGTSSPAKDAGPAAAAEVGASDAQGEVEQKRSGNFFTSRLGSGKKPKGGPSDGEGELEIAPYTPPAKEPPRECFGGGTDNGAEGEGEVNGQGETDALATSDGDSVPPETPRSQPASALKQHMETFAKSVLPKVEPLPWTTFLCLSVWCAIP